MVKELAWRPEPGELALVLPNERYPDLGKVKRLSLGPGQMAVVFVRDRPRPLVLSGGSHKLPKEATKLVLVSTGPKESFYGVPKGMVYGQLGFSGKLTLRIGDGPEEVEDFVEELVLGRSITTLEELVKWLVHNYLAPAFKDVVARRGMPPEEFVRAGWEELAEEVKDVVNSYLMRYGLYLENISVLWWAGPEGPLGLTP